MRDWIASTFELLQRGGSEAAVIDRLNQMGCPGFVAEKLVCLLPLACGRILLSGMGVTFSPTIRRMAPDGTIGPPQNLSDDAQWIAIEQWLSKHADADVVRRVGMQSAEFDAVNKALLNGSRPEDLVGAPPIFA